MWRRRLATVLLVSVLTAALGGMTAPRAAAPVRPDAGAFVERLVVQIVRDDYARAWLTLHPAHKAVAPRWQYVQCERRSPVPGAIASLRIVGSRNERVLVAGVGRVPGRAVTFRLVLRDPAYGSVTVTHTAHVVAVNGRWRWILTPERYALYRAGCDPPLPSV
jgi:hypothetical protein